LSTKKEQK